MLVSWGTMIDGTARASDRFDTAQADPMALQLSGDGDDRHAPGRSAFVSTSIELSGMLS
jgi:hypothetical protein